MGSSSGNKVSTAFMLRLHSNLLPTTSTHSVPDNDDIDTFVDLLSTNPFLAVAYNESYGLISWQSVGNATKVRCNRYAYQTCTHTTTFMEWCTTQGLTEEIIPQILDAEYSETFTSVSHRRIPYPLSEALRSIHDTLESGEQRFSLNLVPHMEDYTCIHVNRYVMYTTLVAIFK